MSDDGDEMNMSAFMRDGGLDEDIANRKKKAKEEEEERKREEEEEKRIKDRKRKASMIVPLEEAKVFVTEEEIVDTKPSDRMEGFMLIKKSKLDKKTSAIPGIPGFTTGMTVNTKKYFAIRSGILY